MAMTGLRRVTTGLGLLRKPPPEEIATEGVPGLFARIPPGKRGAAIELAHFGYAEPLLIGAMGSGGLLLIFAMGQWLRRPPSAFAWVLRVVLPAVAGLALWLLGVFSKEVSICFLALAPFLYLYLERRWREAGLLPTRLMREPAFLAVGALLMAPVIYMAAVVVTISSRKQVGYGAAVPEPGEGRLERVADAVSSQWAASAGLLGSPLWRIVAVAVVLLLVAVAIRRRRLPWLALGLMVTGCAVLVAQGYAGGGPNTRYLLPVIALFAMAGALLIAATPRFVQLAVGVVALIFVAMGVSRAHESVESWASAEISDTQVVQAAAELDPARCPVYQEGFDPERAGALPRLVALEEPRGRRCVAAFEAVLITPVTSGSSVTGAVAEACAPPGWEQVGIGPVPTVFGCRRVRNEQKLLPGLQLEVGDVLAQRRLMPG